MQAGILSVRTKQTAADLRMARDNTRSRLTTMAGVQRPIETDEGILPSGNHYYYVAFQEKTEQGPAVYVAHSFVWCPDRQLLVEMVFEGQLTMLSANGQEAQRNLFATTAREICLSVR